MDVIVNGEARQLSEATTVSQLLESLQIAPERIVVELNLTILKRVQHATTVLKTGDQVEIVQFVGGGASMSQCVNASMRTRIHPLTH